MDWLEGNQSLVFHRNEGRWSQENRIARSTHHSGRIADGGEHNWKEK